MKKLKKILLYSIIAFVGLALCFVASIFIFKNQIVGRFIKEANKHINLPVTVGKIEVTVLRNFPDLTIVFYDVYVEDSQPEISPLFTSKKVSFNLNPLKLWNGVYSIQELNTVDSQLNMNINKAGTGNYNLLKKSDSKTKVSFELTNVKLENTAFSYKNDLANIHHKLSSKILNTEIKINDSLYQVFFEGDIFIHQIGSEQMNFLPNKEIDIEVSLNFNDNDKKLTISSALLNIKKAQFEISGFCSLTDPVSIDIRTVGKKTDIQTLLSLVPGNISQRFSKYESTGEVYFDMSLKGKISDDKFPTLSVHFGLKNAQVYNSAYKSRIENANLNGLMIMQGLPKLDSTKLSLSNISATLQGNPIEGNFELVNFNDPFIVADFTGVINAQDLLNFYPIKSIKEISGIIKGNISLNGNLAMLKEKSTMLKFYTSGNFEFGNLNLQLNSSASGFDNWNGQVQFNHTDLIMNHITGKFGNSDFKFDGALKNIIPYIIFSGQPLGIEADINTQYLDIDQILEANLSDKKQEDSSLKIPPDLVMNFNTNIRAVKYKNFLGRLFTGNLFVKDKVAVARNISFESLGGKISMSGIFDAKNNDANDLINTIHFSGINLDSLFYAFDNFNQKFIGYQHLKGKLDAELNLQTTLGKNLKIVPESMIVDATASIKNGELNYFEPIQKLNKYLDDEGLRKLKFSEITNHIHIENKVLYIPQMEIKSNVTTLSISGTHSFDQHIDYHLSAPLKNKKKLDSDEAFGAIEEDKTGKSKIFIHIFGTTDNYKIQLDKVAVMKKMVSDIKNEVKELNEAFKMEGQKKKKTIELDKDSYFDWDNKDNN